MRLPFAVVSLFLFALVAYAVATFAMWQWQPHEWPPVVRGLAASATFAMWLWDSSR